MRFLDYLVFLNKFEALFLLLFGCAVPVSAFDLEDAILEALKANPELKSHYNQWKAGQKKMIQVRALPEPGVTYTEFLSEVQTRTGPQERIFQLNQPFPWPGKLALRGGIANRDAEAAFHQYEAAQREVIRRIADAYFDYALLGENISITRQNISYINQLIPVVEEKVRGGGRLADSLLLEIEKEKTEDELEGLRERRPTLSSRLEMEMGRSPNLKRSLPFPYLSKKNISLPSIASLEAKLDRHPLIAAATSRVLSYELKKKLAEKSSLPDMSLGANVIDIGDRGDTGFGVVLGFKLPIRRHKYQAEKEQARLEQAASCNLKASIANDLKFQLHREYQKLKDAQRRASLFRDRLIPKAEQTLSQLEEAYRTNKSGIDEVVDAEKMLLQLKLEGLTAHAEAQKRAVYIRVLTEPIKQKCIQAVPVILSD